MSEQRPNENRQSERVVEWNPILLRETRARFRHWGAFALLLAYAAILAFAIAWNYSDAVERVYVAGGVPQRLSAVGRELFLTFTWMQALLWVLIGPALTASSIAREREDGLLEGILLSPLSPPKIAFGKLLSALSFVGLLILASLPVQAIFFLTGGVSPGDFFSALFLHFTTAICSATIGLACSAWSKRANVALRSAYVLVIVWMIGSALCLAFGGRSGTALLSGVRATLEISFAWTNPILAAVALVEPGNISLSAPTILENAPWLWSAIFQWLLTFALFALSTLALKKPFEARDEAKLSRIQKPVVLPIVAVSTPEWEMRSSDLPVAAETRTAAAPRAAQDWMEVPGASQLAFKNPVLQREARGKFRMKAPPLWALIGEGLLALVVGYFYVMTFWAALTNRNARETIWWVLVFVALFVIALAAGVMGASAFTREREGQTWNALRLSLLGPNEIISAKLGAILLSFAVYSAPFWPLLIPCIKPALVSRGSFGTDDGVSISHVLLALGISTATAFCYALWGMWWSWRCRRTVVAVGWTLSSLFLLLVFIPLFFNNLFKVFSNDQFSYFYHPFVALGIAVGDNNLLIGLLCLTFLCAVGIMLWLHLRFQIQRADRHEL